MQVFMSAMPCVSVRCPENQHPHSLTVAPGSLTRPVRKTRR